MESAILRPELGYHSPLGGRSTHLTTKRMHSGRNRIMTRVLQGIAFSLFATKNGFMNSCAATAFPFVGTVYGCQCPDAPL